MLFRSEITEEQLKEMEKVYKTYRKSKSKSNNIELYNEEGMDNITCNDVDFKTLNFDYISDDIQRLANLAVYINYYLYPKSSKNFCWDLFAEGILLNIYDNSNKTFTIPILNKNGDINYMGKTYHNERIDIECQ